MPKLLTRRTLKLLNNNVLKELCKRHGCNVKKSIEDNVDQLLDKFPTGVAVDAEDVDTWVYEHTPLSRREMSAKRSVPQEDEEPETPPRKKRALSTPPRPVKTRNVGGSSPTLAPGSDDDHIGMSTRAKGKGKARVLPEDELDEQVKVEAVSASSPTARGSDDAIPQPESPIQQFTPPQNPDPISPHSATPSFHSAHSSQPSLHSSHPPSPSLPRHRAATRSPTPFPPFPATSADADADGTWRRAHRASHARALGCSVPSLSLSLSRSLNSACGAQRPSPLPSAPAPDEADEEAEIEPESEYEALERAMGKIREAAAKRDVVALLGAFRTLLGCVRDVEVLPEMSAEVRDVLLKILIEQEEERREEARVEAVLIPAGDEGEESTGGARKRRWGEDREGEGGGSGPRKRVKREDEGSRERQRVIVEGALSRTQ